MQSCNLHHFQAHLSSDFWAFLRSKLVEGQPQMPKAPNWIPSGQVMSSRPQGDDVRGKFVFEVKLGQKNLCNFVPSLPAISMRCFWGRYFLFYMIHAMHNIITNKMPMFILPKGARSRIRLSTRRCDLNLRLVGTNMCEQENLTKACTHRFPHKYPCNPRHIFQAT